MKICGNKVVTSILIFTALLFCANIVFADSLSMGNIKGKRKRCWYGNVEVDVAYELTSKGTSRVFLMSDNDKNGGMISIASAVVTRGTGVVTLRGDAGGCTQKFDVMWGN